MPKIIVASRYEDTYKEIISLAEQKESSGALSFFTMTNVKRLGINPLSGTLSKFKKRGVKNIPPNASNFDTPVGIYCYPFNVNWAVGAVNNNLPYAVNRKYICVFDIKSKLAQYKPDLAIGKPTILFTSKKITKSRLNKYVDAIRSLVPSFKHTKKEFDEMTAKARNKTPIGLLWYYTMVAAEASYNDIKKIARETWSIPVRRWTWLMRQLGIVAFIDDAEQGIIHPNEPMQAVILDPGVAIDKKSWRHFRSPSGSKGLIKKEKDLIKLPIYDMMILPGDNKYGDFERVMTKAIAVNTGSKPGVKIKKVAENYWVAIDARSQQPFYGWINGLYPTGRLISSLVHRNLEGKRFIFTNASAGKEFSNLLHGPIKDGRRRDWVVCNMEASRDNLISKYNSMFNDPKRPRSVNQKVFMSDVAAEIPAIRNEEYDIPELDGVKTKTVDIAIISGVISGTLALRNYGEMVNVEFDDGFITSVIIDTMTGKKGAENERIEASFNNGIFQQSVSNETVYLGNRKTNKTRTVHANGTISEVVYFNGEVVIDYLIDERYIFDDGSTGIMEISTMYFPPGSDKILIKDYTQKTEDKDENESPLGDYLISSNRTVYDPNTQEEIASLDIDDGFIGIYVSNGLVFLENKELFAYLMGIGPRSILPDTSDPKPQPDRVRQFFADARSYMTP